MLKSIAVLTVSALIASMFASPVVAASSKLDCAAAWDATSANNKCKVSGLGRHSDTQCILSKEYCEGYHGAPNFIQQVIIWSPKTQTVDADAAGIMHVKPK